jgi:hypothetical protein
MKAPTKEQTVAVFAQALTHNKPNKTSPRFFTQLNAAEKQLGFAASLSQELQDIYKANRPALKKELTTKIAGILTRGSLNFLGKPTLNKELLTAVEATQKNMVTSKDVKDDELKQTPSAPTPSSPRR